MIIYERTMALKPVAIRGKRPIYLSGLTNRIIITLLSFKYQEQNVGKTKLMKSYLCNFGSAIHWLGPRNVRPSLSSWQLFHQAIFPLWLSVKAQLNRVCYN